MIIAIIPAIFAVIGLIVYFASEKPKVQTIAEDVFWTSFLVVMAVLAKETITLP